MRKLLLGFAALSVVVCSFAQGNSTGIAYGQGRVETSRGTMIDTRFWVASTEAGIYGRFWCAEIWDKRRGYEVDISLYHFTTFQCREAAFFLAGHGYVNGTPRIVAIFGVDNTWFSDLFAIATFHPISGNLIYEREGYFKRGGVSVLCEGPGNGDS